MTDKIKKAYSSLDKKYKIAISSLIIILVLITSALTAIAASGISFSGQTPADGNSIGDPTPNISVNATAQEGQITLDHIKMYVGSELVTNPSLTVSSNVYTISYTPIQKLADGQQTVTVNVYDDSLKDYETTSWSFTVDAAPKASNLLPAIESTIDTASPKISAYIKDTYDNLDKNIISLKIDQDPVTPNFTFKGRWYTDSCTGTQYYVIESYKEGTLAYQASNLSDGIHTIELSMADVNGNISVKQWSFNVSSKPKFSEFTPANGTENQSVSSISLKAMDDNGSIDPGSIVFKDNGVKISHSFDSATGIISYSGPLDNGKHEISVSAADTVGNTGTANWSFVVDDQPPAVDVNSTYFQNGMVTSDGNIDFRATLTDLVDINDNVGLSLDGSPLTINFKYDGYTNYYGNWIVTSKKKAYVSYKGTVNDGNHNLTLHVEDKLGNNKTYAWTFSTSSTPIITDLNPILYGIQDLKPTISATLKDSNGTISSISLNLDGNDITNYNYDVSTEKLTYTPSEPLSNESYHTVTLCVYDDSGLSTSKTWGFYTNTYPEMSDSSYINCTACHTIDSNNPLQSTGIHKLSFGGTHTYNDCNICHDYISYPDACLQCHGIDGAEYAPHGSTPTITYKPKNYDTFFPIRVMENREMFDCVICHQPGSQIQRKTGISMTNHDIPELHKVNEPSCSKCHALSLTREHARDNRVNSDNQPIECNTCHKSTDTKVQNAIINKDKSCSACHENTDHDSLHTVIPNINCQSCHKSTLTLEHSTRTNESGNYYSCETCHESDDLMVQTAIATNNKSCSACHVNTNHDSLHNTPLDMNCQTCHRETLTEDHLSRTNIDGDNYTCNTCHNSDKNNVDRSIAANQINCGGCHQDGHNMEFADIIPKDIPLYDNYQWTDPIEAAIFTGESTTPTDYESGQVVISNRRIDVTATQVWEFYNTRLTSNGWTLNSNPPNGAEVFTAEFAKEERLVIIKCFNTLASDGTGGLISTGYRIEIWYK